MGVPCTLRVSTTRGLTFPPPFSTITNSHMNKKLDLKAGRSSGIRIILHKFYIQTNLPIINKHFGHDKI